MTLKPTLIVTLTSNSGQYINRDSTLCCNITVNLAIKDSKMPFVGMGQFCVEVLFHLTVSVKE